MCAKSDNSNKQILWEVCIIRVILIILLVLYHSFAPYCGSWPSIPDSDNIDIYLWIALLSYSFMLETFVFISGYVFGFQVSKKSLDTKKTIRNKIKRIILPSILFSYLYLLSFSTIHVDSLDSLISILSGVGHLWFLPMLFWCFILTILLEKSSLNYKFAILLVLSMSILSLIKLPLRINQSFNYLIFFYIGYLLRRKQYDISRFCKKSIIVIFFILYIIAVSCGIYLKSILIDGTLIAKIVKFSYSLFGVITIFLTSYYLVYIKGFKLSTFFLQLSNICFGVYIFQEFILRFLYYKTNLCYVIDSYSLPWICFIITLIISCALTVLLRTNKIGRFILG